MTEGQALLGTTIAGKYRIRRLVGLGGMGAVYEGEHVELGKRIAVKIIDTASLTSSELTTRFKREARAASAVESEHIVQVFDVGSDPEIGLYMVMEYLVGEDLECRLRKEPGRRLDAVTASLLGHQVARALVKAHGARVIHRDLKPANIFLTTSDEGTLRVKVLDFGISKLLASDSPTASKREQLALTQEGVALGTPQYMSPEQAQGLTTIDHRTDVWSLGAVLYEAVAGRPAYTEMRTYEEVIMKILQERPPSLFEIAPWVPEQLAAVIHDALQHDVKRRIPDCQTFANRLSAAVPGGVRLSTGPFGAARASGLADTAPEPWKPRTMAANAETQVVIRPSDAGASAFDDPDPSRTMLAEGVPSTRKDPPKIILRERGSRPSLVADEEQDVMSTGDPTMFQPPAWVENGSANAAADGPTTLRTAVRSLLAEGARGTIPKGNVLTATLTALVVVVVGGTIMLLSRGGGGDASTDPASTTSSATSASAPPESETIEPTVTSEPASVRAAPPATGTGAGLDTEPVPPLPGNAATVAPSGRSLVAPSLANDASPGEGAAAPKPNRAPGYVPRDPSSAPKP